MRANAARTFFPSQIAALALASAIVIPSGAQTTPPASTSQDNPPSATTQQQPSPTAQEPLTQSTKEGFWGRMNPMARKKWVKKQTDPINDRLNELDEVNAKNAKDIQDVDARAQAGIKQAQSTADTANQTATAAATQAQNANEIATKASGREDGLSQTIGGIDTYKPVNEVEVPFKRGSTALSDDAKKQLDDLAASVKDHKGYVVEIEAHSPARGVTGVENSERLATAVKRYLVERDIPVHRLHSVGLGNAQAASAGEDAAPIKTSSVHVRLMVNSLAARDAAPPQGAASTTGAERP
ncbi:MAG TPA: OmpA family protein [Terracidiphilus sp.]|nr:OmpA family protein [Terracidiphilus sp.]